MTWRAVTDAPWQHMAAQLPRRPPSRRGGRPRLRDRPCFEGIRWMVWTGAPWSELPARYGSQSAVHSRLAEWAARGVRLALWRALLDQRNNARQMRWNACFVDGLFVPANQGATVWAQPHAARETTRMVLADGQGTPLGILVEKAAPADVTLLERTLEAVKMTRRRGRPCRPHQPERLLADRGDDSTGARALWVTRAIKPSIPRRQRHAVATYQDGRKLRRYRHRWVIERTNAWLQNFRRLMGRYEHQVKNFEALVHLVCALITLKQVSG